MGKKKEASKTAGDSNLVKSSKIEEVDAPVKSAKAFPTDAVRFSERFKAISRLAVRDLNQRAAHTKKERYTRELIQGYISDPENNETNLRGAVNYLYGASPHFRRLIRYFVGLTDWSYFISPSKADIQKVNKNTLYKNYKKTLMVMESLNIGTQFSNILTICLREDVYYGTLWVTDAGIIVQKLPSEFCAISAIEDNVLNVTFDFSYFDRREDRLDFFPEEFRRKYNVYKKEASDPTKRGQGGKWIELDAPTSFAIKTNSDILDYAMPPFAGVLREVYDLEDYKHLKMSKTALENYAMLNMILPMSNDGEWLLDHDTARDFWRNLDSVLPDEIGSILSPMRVEKIGFERSGVGETNTIAEAEQNLFTAAGVSSLLFNNEKASANALSLSIKVDQEFTYGIVKSIGDMLNRYLASTTYGKMFKATFLNVSAFNRVEVGREYLYAAQYGLPVITMFAVSQGLKQIDIDAMNLLENDVLELKKKLVPLQGASTLTAKQTSGDSKGGRPKKEDGELTDSGEQTREDGDDWG